MSGIYTLLVMGVSVFLIGEFLIRTPEPLSEIKYQACFVYGLMVWTLVSSYSYQLGVSPSISGLILYICALLIGLKRVRGFFKAIKPKDTKIQKSIIIANSICAMVFMTFIALPAILKGINFSVFQGNHWDNLSYIGISQSISNYSFEEIKNGFQSGLAFNDPVSVLALNSLYSRPNVEILYTSLVAPLGVSIVDNAYFFLIMLEAALGVSIFGFVKYFSKAVTSNGRRNMVLILSTLFIVGFWGQYLIDLNAWSALSVAGAMLISIVFIDCWIRSQGFVFGIQTTLLLVAMFLLYPEGSIYILVLLLLYFVIELLRSKKSFKLVLSKIIFLILSVYVCINLFQYRTLDFLLRQITIGNSDVTKPWAAYFQAFLSGRTGMLDSSTSDLLQTIPMAISGMYFLSPIEKISTSLGTIQQIISLVSLMAFLAILAANFLRKNRFTIEYLILPPLILIPLVSYHSSIWTGGKILSFSVPIVFAIVLVMMTDLMFQRSIGNFKTVVFTIIISVWGISQVQFGISRISSVMRTGYPHEFPYISIQDTSLKLTQDWKLRKSSFNGCKYILVDIEEPFQKYYAEMKLNEFKLAWIDLKPLNSYFSAGDNFGYMKSNGQPIDCKLINYGEELKTFLVLKSDSSTIRRFM